MDQLKVCCKCKESKAHSDFNKDKSRKDGLRSQCKICVKELNVNWYGNNTERVKERTKNWREANPERHKENSKNWCKANSERARERSKNWRKDNKEHINEYLKQKRKTDIQFKLRGDLRRTTRRLINLAGKIKEQSTEEFMDAEFTEAENILLDQMFKDGYTIEQLLNGELELDHKQPLAWFDLTNEDEYREAGHISNLHYITKEENRKKRDRYAHGPNNEIILHEEWLKKRKVPTISH